MGQAPAQGPPTQEIQDGGRPTELVAAILDADAAKTLEKSFDKTIIKKA